MTGSTCKIRFRLGAIRIQTLRGAMLIVIKVESFLEVSSEAQRLSATLKTFFRLGTLPLSKFLDNFYSIILYGSWLYGECQWEVFSNPTHMIQRDVLRQNLHTDTSRTLSCMVSIFPK